MIENTPQQIRTLISMLGDQSIDAPSTCSEQEMHDEISATLKAVSPEAQLKSALVQGQAVEVAFSHPTTGDRVWLATVQRLVSL